MKNIMYVLVASLLGSSAAYAQSQVRATATGEVNLKGVDITVEEQVRENIDISNIDPLSLPEYNHTRLTLSKTFTDIYTLKGTSVTIGAGARNAIMGGEALNRLQLDGEAKYSFRGLGLALGKSVQQNVDSANIANIGLGSFVMRDKLTLDYSHTLYDLTLGAHVGDEVFISESGIVENRALIGASVTALDNVTLVAEYFLQTQGDLLTPDLQVLGDHENAHVVALNAIVSF